MSTVVMSVENEERFFSREHYHSLNQQIVSTYQINSCFYNEKKKQQSCLITTIFFILLLLI